MGSQVTIRFERASTACLNAGIVARAVVAMPVTTVRGSPALKPSTVSVVHARPLAWPLAWPLACLMRSTISCAVSANGGEACRAWATAGAAIVPAAVSAMNSRLEMRLPGMSFMDQDCSALQLQLQSGASLVDQSVDLQPIRPMPMSSAASWLPRRSSRPPLSCGSS